MGEKKEKTLGDAVNMENVTTLCEKLKAAVIEEGCDDKYSLLEILVGMNLTTTAFIDFMGGGGHINISKEQMVRISQQIIALALKEDKEDLTHLILNPVVEA